MKTAIYPGSFNPWHKGHEDIVEKALMVFDDIVIAQGINPEKIPSEKDTLKEKDIFPLKPDHFMKRISICTFMGFLHETVLEIDARMKIHAVVRGLRNGMDLQYEQNQQYWYEDLGLKIPIVYFITDRKLGHISSSAIRAIEKIRG